MCGVSVCARVFVCYVLYMCCVLCVCFVCLSRNGLIAARSSQGTDLVEVPLRLVEAHERELRLYAAALEDRLLQSVGDVGGGALLRCIPYSVTIEESK